MGKILKPKSFGYAVNKVNKLKFACACTNFLMTASSTRGHEVLTDRQTNNIQTANKVKDRFVDRLYVTEPLRNGTFIPIRIPLRKMIFEVPMQDQKFKPIIIVYIPLF